MHQRRSRAELPPSGMGPEVLELEFCAQEQEEMGEQEKTVFLSQHLPMKCQHQFSWTLGTWGLRQG